MPPHSPRVAIFDEFLDAFARIPRAQQKKVNKFLRRFRRDPTDASINYERIRQFRDPKLRTVRIDQAWRAVVARPDTGDVYVLLWVDHHDKAMRWAENKRVSIHPETGSLQVLTGETVQVPEPEPARAEAPPLYEGVRDRELLRLGVPQDRLSEIRALRTLQQLEEIREALPPEAFEALYWLGEGEPLDEVERAMAVSAPARVDTADYQAALERDASKRRFAVVEDDAALEAMLDAPLEKWRVFLHPSQRKLVYRRWNGPVRVLGGAGTGKSVVAMHRAAWLAERIYTEPGDRVLFTTFTRNLAADTAANIARICDPEALSRIHVVHLDAWVAGLLERDGYPYTIQWWGMGDTLEELWEKALGLYASDDFEPSFYRDEWEQVIQPQGCETWEDYRRARRTGRGVGLTRRQRRAIWPVFEEYRHQLDRRKFREPEDALRDARALVEKGRVRPNLSSIVVDEAQDMSTNAFALFRAVMGKQRPDDLFIVGDGHQRIYRKRVVLLRAGVDIRGRGHRLRINYRTTDEIRRYAVSVLEDREFDDLDAGTDSTRGYRSLLHGAPPEVRVLPDRDGELATIAAWLEGTDLSRACLVARTNAAVDRYARALEDRGVPTRRVRRTAPDDPTAPGLRVATMHRVKGLEFDRVVLAGLTPDAIPSRTAVERSRDTAIRDEAELMERSLLYVALTRARRAVLVTAVGQVSGWVESGDR